MITWTGLKSKMDSALQSTVMVLDSYGITWSSVALLIIAVKLARPTVVIIVAMLISIFSGYILQKNLPLISIESIIVCDADY